ncbi:hypothetical protein M0802_016163 [Mischocyttarus mexicanus]|nr:hypothetical protein M0802_016163 [Mischocyttarus mexicanus]
MSVSLVDIRECREEIAGAYIRFHVDCFVCAMSLDVVQEWEIILILYQSVFVTESEQFRWDISTVAYGCEVVFIRTAEFVDNWIVYLRVISIVTSAQFNDKAVHSDDISQIIYFSIAYVFLIVRFSRSVCSDAKPEH